MARVAGKVQEHIVTGAMQRAGDTEGIYVIHIPIESLQAVERTKGLPEIGFAEPNYINRHIPLAWSK